MMSQHGKKTIAIHILPNISRSKGNQTMEFGLLIEYIMRNIFPENNSYKSFLRNKKESEISLPVSFST